MAMRYYAPYPGGGNPPRPLGSHVLRVGDADRDAAAADLSEHYVAGRLTLFELHERLGAVFAAKTRGQLGRPFADLPALPQPAGPPRRDLGGFPPPRGPRQETATDRAGRFAALSLLILAMLIWLTTALLFARYGYHQQMHQHFPPMQAPFNG
jgi:hypothetical protein